MSTNCDTCIHHFEMPKLEGGGLVCRASPPTPFLIPASNGGAQVMAFFPPVNPQFSCGLYEPEIFDDEPNEESEGTENARNH